MSIQAMQDNVIRSLGFECRQTIHFFRTCESGNLDRIRQEYDKIMGVR